MTTEKILEGMDAQAAARRGTTVAGDPLTDSIRTPKRPTDFVADPILRLRAVERDLARRLDPTQPRRQGRQCGDELLGCAHAYVKAVLARADSAADGGGALDRNALLAIDAAARGRTDVPSWRLREFLRRQDVPDAFIVRHVHAEGNGNPRGAGRGVRSRSKDVPHGAGGVRRVPSMK